MNSRRAAPPVAGAEHAIVIALLRRMADFRGVEDKLQCVLMALVVLGHACADTDALLLALQRAVRAVDAARLARDVRAMTLHLPRVCSVHGAEAYALTTLCAAIASCENVEED